MDTAEDIWFVPLERSFDVDSNSCKEIFFLTKNRFSMTLYRLIDGSKDFQLSCITVQQL